MRTILQLNANDEQWVEEFAAGLEKADLSPVTVKGYRHDMELFLRWFAEACGEDTRLETLSSIDIINYRQHMTGIERLKAATVNRRLQALRRFCRWACRQGKLSSDPSTEVKTLKTAPRRQPAGIEVKEVYGLLRAAGRTREGLAKRNYAIIQLMVQTGLRVGEVAALRISDAVLRDRSGYLRVREGKGRKERVVPLNAAVRRALHIHLESLEPYRPGDPLFITKRTDAMSVRAIQSLVRNLARRANITRIHVSPHTLRHTFALNYLKHNPGKLVSLATLLGHDSLDTTAVYTRPSMEDLAADLERSPLNVFE